MTDNVYRFEPLPDQPEPGPPRHYPLLRTEADSRFTLGLTSDVAAVLEGRGYPPIVSKDFIDLQQALFRFLYGRSGEGT